VAEVCEAGIDWVTCTAKHVERRVALIDLARAIADREWQQQGEVREYTWQGYQMKQTGGITYGTRDADAICRLSGALANVFGLEVVKRADNISRLDVQATCRFDPPRDDLGQLAFRTAVRHFRRHPRAPRPRAHVTPEGYETVTLGSRASDWFGRIYDKYRESGEARYAGCWRFELEIKGKTCPMVARALAHHEHPERSAISLVRDHCARAGIKPAPFGIDAGMRRPSQARQTTDDKRIKWLSEQGRSVVAGLTARGRWLDTYTALGFVQVYTFKKTKSTEGLA
jgi:hypothetical protein